jgi:hypothetical protein
MKPESKPLSAIDILLATTISGIILSFLVNQII